MPERYECSCCEELTLREPPPGTYQICRVCNWEDDNMQVHRIAQFLPVCDVPTCVWLHFAHTRFLKASDGLKRH